MIRCLERGSKKSWSLGALQVNELTAGSTASVLRRSIFISAGDPTGILVSETRVAGARLVCPRRSCTVGAQGRRPTDWMRSSFRCKSSSVQISECLAILDFTSLSKDYKAGLFRLQIYWPPASSAFCTRVIEVMLRHSLSQFPSF